MANQGKAQLPQCLLQRFSVNGDVYSEIRVALYKNDTCYVIDRWDSSTTGHEMIVINKKRRMPEYVQPEVYNKKCKSIKFLKNKNIIYTSKIYRWQEFSPLIKQVPKVGARLPQCVIQKISVGDNFSHIRIALYKNDTCYVIDRRTWDADKITRHEIQMINFKREMPEYLQPEVYNKECKPLNFIKNKDLRYTSEKYSWWELENVIKNKIN